MKLEILMSCMHQCGDTLIQRSNITGDAVVINQCDTNAFTAWSIPGGTARMYSVTERGLTSGSGHF